MVLTLNELTWEFSFSCKSNLNKNGITLHMYPSGILRQDCTNDTWQTAKVTQGQSTVLVTMCPYSADRLLAPLVLERLLSDRPLAYCNDIQSRFIIVCTLIWGIHMRNANLYYDAKLSYGTCMWLTHHKETLQHVHSRWKSNIHPEGLCSASCL